MIVSDVVIVGAGPAGCSAALALKGSGKKVLLVDKSFFPRSKTCGDSVPAHALLGLENLVPGIYDDFLSTVESVSFRQSALVFPNGQKLFFSWPLPGYVAERRAFDGFLLEKVLGSTDTQVITGLKVVDYKRSDQLIKLATSNIGGTSGPDILASVVIAADGAPSLAARKLAGVMPDPEAYGQAVRCYFDGVKGMDEGIELVFYHPHFFPGYFWIFPMPGGRVNAGFGMPEVARRKLKISLSELFKQFREQHPEVRKMLEQAVQAGDLRGGMVPFAMKRQIWSGPGFMLTGDAASMVDPVSGDGIMQAVRSGVLAGIAASTGNIAMYDQQIEKYLWNCMKSQRRTIRLMSGFPQLIRIAAWLGRFDWLRKRFQRWIW